MLLMLQLNVYAHTVSERIESVVYMYYYTQ
jgi:hypothetical protein